MVCVVASCFSEEDDEEEAAHVEGGEEGDEAGDDEEGIVFCIEGTLENLLFRPEAGGDEGEAAEGGGADEEGDGGDGHLFPEAAHFPDVFARGGRRR